MANTYSIVAKVDPKVAYSYVADLNRHVEWSPDNLQIQPEQTGPIQVGSRFKTVGHLQGKPNPSTVEVVAMEEPRLFAFKSTDGNSEWLHEFSFVPESGGTRIDRKVTVLRAPTFLYVVWPILHPLVVKPGNMKSMGMLRDHLERLPALPA